MKFLMKLCAVVLLLAFSAGTVFADEADFRASEEDGRVFMGVRAVFESVGFDVAWDDGRITLSRGADVLTLAVGSGEFTINGEARNLFEPARNVGGVTIAPIRPLLHAAGYSLAPGGEILPHFILGPEAHGAPPQTFEEFVPTLAAQMARYSSAAASLWPNVADDIFFMVDNLDTGQLWKFYPSGEHRLVDDDEVFELGLERVDPEEPREAWIRVGRGIYFSMTEADVVDFENQANRPYVGTYEALPAFVHYVMHIFEQPNWAETPFEEMHNTDRNEFLEDTGARAARYLMQQQLLTAMANPGDMRLVRDAAATIGRWRTEFSQDFLNAQIHDRIEGTAFYFEMLAGLISAYPGQIETMRDLDRAVSEMALWYLENRIVLGVTNESYSIGAWAGVLLTRLDSTWFGRLIADPRATPVTLLYDFFDDLPAPVIMPEAELVRIAQIISDRLFFLAELQMGMIPDWIAMLAGMEGEELAGFAGFVEFSLNELENIANNLNPPQNQIVFGFIAEMRELLEAAVNN